MRELEDFGITVQLHDPMADAALLDEEYGLKLTVLEKLLPADALVLAVAHRPYRDSGWALVSKLLKPGGFVADVPALLDRASTPPGVTLWRLLTDRPAPITPSAPRLPISPAVGLGQTGSTGRPDAGRALLTATRPTDRKVGSPEGDGDRCDGRRQDDRGLEPAHVLRGQA